MRYWLRMVSDMALRIRGNTVNNSGSNALSGFSLSFTNNITYDLDRIAAGRNMSDSSQPLVLEVKNNRAIAEAVAKKLSISVDDKIKENNLQNKVVEILESAMSKYSVTDITSAYFSSFVLAYANSELNRYLKTLLGDGLKFKISILKYDKTIDVSYNFENEKYFEKALANAYSMYKSQLESVGVGGLAISGQKNGNISVTSDDYKKYLLSENAYSGTANNRVAPGERTPLVIWSEGTDDTTESDVGAQSIADQLADVKKQLEDLLAKYDNMISVPKLPDEEGKYVLRGTVENGTKTYSWIEMDLMEKHTTISVDNTGNAYIGPSVEYTVLPESPYYNLIVNGVAYNEIEGASTYNLVEDNTI